MPSSTARSCTPLNFLLVWFLNAFARYSGPVGPELPLSTLDLPTHHAVGIPSVPEDVTENELLVLSSHWQRELELPRFRDVVREDTRNNAYSEAAQDSPETTASVKAAEFISLFSVSPILPAHSPPLIHVSPLSTAHSPKLCSSLLDLEHGAEGGSDSWPSLAQASSIGDLGKRRGFKGAPLFTSATARRPSFLSLSSAFSPKMPLSPSTPRPPPSTPRTPLAAVTNLIRASTAKSPAKSPRSSSIMQSDPPISDGLQQCYDQGDPFSVMGESLYIPEIICASVPFKNLDRFEVYRAAPHRTLPVRSHKTFFRAVEAASRTKPSIRDTNIYDMMVYNFQPKARNIGQKRRRPAAPSAFFFTLHRPLGPSNATTTTCLVFRTEEPRVCLPRNFWRDCDVFAEHPRTYAVPVDFSRTLDPTSLWDSQSVVVKVPTKTASPAPPFKEVGHELPSNALRNSTEDGVATPTRRQCLALDDLLGMLATELESSSQTSAPPDSMSRLV
ncbi:hypothetical protein B0H11DRAFT_2288618 [Mycena galericulata]|nr:hypothetical protein B0H11DRAFT_2288618 [Mycena galericulata]